MPGACIQSARERVAVAARRKAELEVTDSHRVIEGERLVLRAVVVGAACGVVLGALG